MSRENVEIVRQSAVAYIAGGIEAALEYADADIVVHPYPEWLESTGPLRGHGGVRYVDQWATQEFKDPRFELVEIRDAGEKVVALYRQSGVHARSGSRVVQRSAAVCSEFRDGRIGEVSYFLTWEEALKAAGLED